MSLTTNEQIVLYRGMLDATEDCVNAMRVAVDAYDRHGHSSVEYLIQQKVVDATCKARAAKHTQWSVCEKSPPTEAHAKEVLRLAAMIQMSGRGIEDRWVWETVQEIDRLAALIK